MLGAFQVRSPRLGTLISQILIKLDGMVAPKKLSKRAKFFWSVTTRCQYRRGQSFDKRTKCIPFERPYLSLWLFNNRNLVSLDSGDSELSNEPKQDGVKI